MTSPGGSDNSSCSLSITQGFLHRDLLFAGVSENFPWSWGREGRGTPSPIAQHTSELSCLCCS